MVEMLNDAETRWDVVSKAQVVRMWRGGVWCVDARRELEMRKKRTCQDNIDARSSKFRGNYFLCLNYLCFDVVE